MKTKTKSQSKKPVPNKELIKKWVARLRNPNMRQTKLQMKDKRGKGYCCLGHACIVTGLGKFSDRDTFNGEPCYGKMPVSIADMFGIPSNPVLSIPNHLIKKYSLGGINHSRTASILNDAHEFTLKDIADCIEFTYLKKCVK